MSVHAARSFGGLEEGKERIKFLRRDRGELVIVAHGAAARESHPRLDRRARANAAVRLAFLHVGAVTRKAFVREDRADVAVEAQPGFGGGRRGGGNFGESQGRFTANCDAPAADQTPNFKRPTPN